MAVPADVNGTLPSLDPLKPHLVTLLRYAREFDDMTPSDESYSAVDFCDYLALQVAGGPEEARRYSIPAGKPGGKRRKAA